MLDVVLWTTTALGMAGAAGLGAGIWGSGKAAEVTKGATFGITPWLLLAVYAKSERWI